MKLFVRTIVFELFKVEILTRPKLNARARFVAESFLTPVSYLLRSVWVDYPLTARSSSTEYKHRPAFPCPSELFAIDTGHAACGWLSWWKACACRNLNLLDKQHAHHTSTPVRLAMRNETLLMVRLVVRHLCSNHMLPAPAHDLDVESCRSPLTVYTLLFILATVYLVAMHCSHPAGLPLSLFFLVRSCSVATDDPAGVPTAGQCGDHGGTKIHMRGVWCVRRPGTSMLLISSLTLLHLWYTLESRDANRPLRSEGQSRLCFTHFTDKSRLHCALCLLGNFGSPAARLQRSIRSC